MEIETNQMQPKLMILIIITSMAMETNHMMLHLLMSLTITWMKITQPPQIFNGDVVNRRSEGNKNIECIFQYDIKWDHEFKSFWRKIYHAISMCRRVKNAGAPPNIIRSAFFRLVFKLFAFRWSLICDDATKYINKVVSLSKRASILCKEKINLIIQLDKICIKLCSKIPKNHEMHPLSCHFDIRQPSRACRNLRILQPLNLKHKFYRNQFIRFYSYL